MKTEMFKLKKCFFCKKKIFLFSPCPYICMFPTRWTSDMMRPNRGQAGLQATVTQ